MVMMVAVIVLCLATLTLSSGETRSAAVAKQKIQALFVAEAGVECEIAALKGLTRKAGLDDPFASIDALLNTTPINAQTLTKDGVSVGQFTVSIAAIETVDAGTRNVTIRSQGFVPSASAPNRQARTVTAAVRLQLARSGVFDHVYFISNWGWFYGDTITVRGNVRANGRFDAANYRPTIDNVPRYEKIVGATLQGYIDDGGIYAGWDVIADNIEGKAKEKWTQTDADDGRCAQSQVGLYKYQHEYVDQLPMPNLTDLGLYESMAKTQNSSIKVGTTTVCGPVLGDDPGEQQNLFLQGTAANPIVLNGLVVVRGGVIISGVVTGQGSIYAGGNIYVPQDLTYNNGPAALPATTTESALNAWLADNQSKDSLGLFARENIVVGNYTNGTWRSYVNAWLNDSRNQSKEDAGLDLIPNTRYGRDGIPGTADDDLLEADGVWTVDRYTQDDADHGLIPAGKQVGDVIPGSGEDIDGDGVYDGTTTLNDFNIPDALTSTNWAGNVPSGKTYSQISSTGVSKLDAAFYTNHAIAMYTSSSIDLRGCIVSRNESITYGSRFNMNYDFRLMDNDQFDPYLPKTWKPIQVLMWTSD